MFCEVVLPPFGDKSTEGELIGQGWLILRAGSPNTRIASTLAFNALESVVPRVIVRSVREIRGVLLLIRYAL